MTTEFTALDLQRENEGRESIKIDSYNLIFKKCMSKIKTVHEYQKVTKTTFEIPEILFGRALYSKEECQMYIIAKLEQKKFRVKVKEDGVIKISWGDSSKNRKARILKAAKEKQQKEKPLPEPKTPKPTRQISTKTQNRKQEIRDLINRELSF